MQQRWVEITGPTDRKMTINALNSGADGFMADFEDANAPTWRNMVDGHSQPARRDRRARSPTTAPTAATTSSARTRRRCSSARAAGTSPSATCWSTHEPVTGALFDFGLYVFHCARRLLRSGSGPYFYLPKLESHLEARLWNDVFAFAQECLGSRAARSRPRC